MKYSYSWLKELSGTKNSPEKVVELLTMKSMEVEGMEKIGRIPDEIIVGEIMEIKKHPNADKLQLVKVDIGKEKLDIVCGAWNIKVGDKVPVALVGAKLPNGLEIKEAEIRGEKSHGMLCAEDELGIGKDHSGIIILDKNAKIGKAAQEYLGANEEAVMEIKMLPNRSHDALSHVGVAREISALLGKKMVFDFSGIKLLAKKSQKLKIEIRDKKLCPRYIGAVMENVEIKDSPKWMQDRLKACGMNAINSVVDATNYVMLEIGQPLHAFDADKLESDTIIIRRAKENEEINLLDKGAKKLTGKDLLITNGGKPAALAGIKGARIAEIDNGTKNIVLEAASFNAENIRKSRMGMGIRTESSDRYEKDIDPNLAEKAMARVIEILEHTANAKLEGIVDVYPKKIQSWTIKLSLEYANNLLGEIIPQNNIVKILNLLDIKTAVTKNTIIAEVPTYRLDLRTQEDLIEEIGRVWGYEKIKSAPIIAPVEFRDMDEMLKLERKVREKSVGLGLDEVYNYSFYSKKDALDCGLDKIKHFELVNPMNPEQEMVRTSLIPNILKNIRENLKNFESFSLFEIGRAYYPENKSVKEKRMLVMAKVLSEDISSDTFYEIKGVTEDLSESLGMVPKISPVSDYQEKIGHPERLAQIKINGESIGLVGEINPLVLAKFKITKRVAMAEIDLELLLKVLPKEKSYQSIGKFPIVSRDISMVVPKNVTYAEIKNLIQKTGGSLLIGVELFDRFEAKNSLAIRIFMSRNDRTLENLEVDKLMEKIILVLKKELKIEIRK